MHHLPCFFRFLTFSVYDFAVSSFFPTSPYLLFFLPFILSICSSLFDSAGFVPDFLLFSTPFFQFDFFPPLASVVSPSVPPMGGVFFVFLFFGGSYAPPHSGCELASTLMPHLFSCRFEGFVFFPLAPLSPFLLTLTLIFEERLAVFSPFSIFCYWSLLAFCASVFPPSTF